MKGDVIKSVGEELWKEVENAYRDSGKITDEILSALSFVYQSPLLPALDLVDHRNVSHMTSPSGRSVYQVIGSSGTPYTCFTTSLYCSCPAFRYSVLMKDDHLMCKHVLAIKLSEAMKLTKTLEVTDDEMATLLKTIE
ncbi:zinc finger SWIM domain-containing protein 7-like isoform X2 [Mytilus californianus]|uniref:zinc finger SWIM domain-containing protein 7-like isoform X2 n=1 Tax=Mytilus californianus TaxID=6549 RepID=UPI0022470EE1|nr:zinc finger SWIM domain-containing protein 7-like isoform X2 [Mytilus californianus]